MAYDSHAKNGGENFIFFEKGFKKLALRQLQLRFSKNNGGNKGKYNFPSKGTVLISAAGTIGRTVVYNGEPAYFQDSNIVWIDNNETLVTNKYLAYCYSLKPWNVAEGGTIQRLYNDNLMKAIIAVPSIEEQKRITTILDHFDTLCNDLTTGLPAEIEARKKQYEYYRDKLLTF